jgi:cell division protein FtsW
VLKPGHVLALCAIALLTLGVVMVNSAGMSVSSVPSAGTDSLPASPAGVTAESIIFSRTTVYMGLALLAMGAAAFIPIRGLSRWSLKVAGDDRNPRVGLMMLGLGVLAMLVVCALVYVPGLASPRKGSDRWIKMPLLGGDQTMQPSEIAKWGMLGLMAWYAALRVRFIDEFWRGLVPALIALVVVSAFIVKEDLGTGVLVAGACCVVLLAGGTKVWHYLLFLPIAGAGVVAAIVTSPYRVKRIMAFVNPYEDPQGIGYHTIQSLLAISGGGGPGRGLGHGLQKFGYLPEDRTDFIFAIICEELGIAGAALVAGLFITLIWSGFMIVRKERDQLLRLWGLGIITTIGLQAIINLAVVTGLAPTKGIALPLLSSGGTGWILTAFSLGLIISMERTQEREQESPQTATGGAMDTASVTIAPTT